MHISQLRIHEIKAKSKTNITMMPKSLWYLVYISIMHIHPNQKHRYIPYIVRQQNFTKSTSHHHTSRYHSRNNRLNQKKREKSIKWKSKSTNWMTTMSTLRIFTNFAWFMFKSFSRIFWKLSLFICMTVPIV